MTLNPYSNFRIQFQRRENAVLILLWGCGIIGWAITIWLGFARYLASPLGIIDIIGPALLGYSAIVGLQRWPTWKFPALYLCAFTAFSLLNCAFLLFRLPPTSYILALAIYLVILIGGRSYWPKPS